VSVREYRAGDEHGILDLFRRVFRVERSLAHWRWKFLDNPAGREILVAVDRDGRIAGQFASLPNRGWLAGSECRFSQLLDHMVDPALHRRGVYAALARAFHERFVARDPRAIYFGFNLDEIHQIEKRLYGMELLHGVCALERATGAGADGAAAGGRLVRVERVARFTSAIDPLWERCRGSHDAAIVRDARYLDWRYADCPDVGYVLVVARRRWSRRPLGLAVVRLGWPHEPIAALVDWLVAPGEPAAWRALVHAAVAAARAAGLGVVRAWVAPGSPDEDALAEVGFARVPSPFLASVWNDGRPERPLADVRSRWRYTMGDTDIF